VKDGGGIGERMEKIDGGRVGIKFVNPEYFKREEGRIEKIGHNSYFDSFTVDPSLSAVLFFFLYFYCLFDEGIWQLFPFLFFSFSFTLSSQGVQE
jgi:hypothetical protein